VVDSDIDQADDIAAIDAMKAALARAFDLAWERFLQLEGSKAGTETNRKRLAGRIVALARGGETNEDTLAESGLIHLCVLAETVRIGAQPHLPDEAPLGPEAQGSTAYGPETIAAMSAALQLCLETLPLHAPSNALRFLSTHVLDEASRGEHDPERLSRHALEALSKR
jgi:hypothetical protein